MKENSRPKYHGLRRRKYCAGCGVLMDYVEAKTEYQKEMEAEWAECEERRR